MQQKQPQFNLSEHKFDPEPKKVIQNIDDLQKFNNSQGCKLVATFVLKLSASVQDKKISQTQCPDSLKGFLNIFKLLTTLVDDTPPIQQPMRYGNKAYQFWFDKMLEARETISMEIFGQDTKKYQEAWAQIFVYFSDSFGDRTRLDYGTGHELNFILVMLQLFVIGVVQEKDFEAVVNVIFKSYLDLMRKIQTTYFLEPAGSHGVWGLDDYQFMPFIFGASQLKNHLDYTPDSIHSDACLKEGASQYMYFSCVKFIKEMKKGVPFGESSPLLNDISAVPTWNKVTTGLQKMFMAEVMGKLPVMKHLRFGSIITM